LSFSGVPVPWALMYWIRPASCRRPQGVLSADDRRTVRFRARAVEIVRFLAALAMAPDLGAAFRAVS
jgi:hypothetical protein